jgi:hypothetical protein
MLWYERLTKEELDFLETFILNNCDKIKTAQALNVSYSSITTAIKKIKRKVEKVIQDKQNFFLVELSTMRVQKKISQKAYEELRMYHEGF